MKAAKYGGKKRTMSLRARFVVETAVLWLLFCLPINLLTLYLQRMAPDYSHNITSSSDWAAVATQSVLLGAEEEDYDAYVGYESGMDSGRCPVKN